MVLLESISIPFGTPAHDFDLKGIDDLSHTLDEYKDSKVLVMIFMCNHCPYVLGVIHQLIALQSEFKDKGVQFVGINANDSENYPEDGFEKMKEYADEWGMNFPYLRDETQEVAKMYKAQCTPDVFVYDSEKKLAYHGRINDNWQEPENVKSHELKDAIAALVEGKEVNLKQNPSMGCSIKWKN